MSDRLQYCSLFSSYMLKENKMNKYIAILRGINVSGQKKIKMVELKAIFENLDLENVQTYIQSGNVLFDSSVTSKIDLKIIIEAVIVKTFDFEVPVEIRTKSEIELIIENCPYGAIDIDNDGTKVMVSFLSSRPSKAKLDAIKKYVVSPEKLIVIGKEVYLHCPNGYGKSKLSNVFLEKKLGVTATTRNLKSIIKFKELFG